MNKKIIPIGLIMLLLGTTLTMGSHPNHIIIKESYFLSEECECNKIALKNILSNDRGDNLFPVMKNPLMIPTSNPITDISSLTLVSTPSEFSWKNLNGEDWTTPVKNQGNCGSCWDFAAVGALESRINIREGYSDLDPDLSEQYILSCLPAAANYYGRGCWGGDPYAAYYYLINTTAEGNNHNGIIPESCLPYQANDRIPCNEKCDDWVEKLIPLSNCSQIWFGLNFDSPENRQVIKSQIILYGPVASTTNVTEDFQRFYLIHQKSTDYYPYHYEPFANQINHIIVIVGWKDDSSVERGGYWICKNSWGTKWGYNGFFNIEYGTLFTGMGIIWADYDPESFDWPPVAKAGIFKYGIIGQEITFNASESFDPEGEIKSYFWDLGDRTTSHGQSVSHSYLQEGIYQVTLTVSDTNNKTSSDTILIGINQQPLEIELTGGKGFTVIVKNPSDFDIIHKKLDIELSAPIITGNFRTKEIDILTAHSEFILNIPFMGFGRGVITATFEGITQTANFFILGPFVLIR